MSTTAVPTVNPVKMAYGGIEFLVYNELEELRRKGHNVTLFGAEGSDSSHGELATGSSEYD